MAVEMQKADFKGGALLQWLSGLGSLVQTAPKLYEFLSAIAADIAAIRTSRNGAEKTLVNELKADFNLLRAQVTAIHTSMDTLLAKMDADTGIADTNYAATCAPAADGSTNVTAADLNDLAAPTFTVKSE